MEKRNEELVERVEALEHEVRSDDHIISEAYTQIDSLWNAVGRLLDEVVSARNGNVNSAAINEILAAKEKWDNCDFDSMKKH